jgi:hypothetical protein
VIDGVISKGIAHHEREVVCDSSRGHGQTRSEAEELHRVLRSEAFLERHGVEVWYMGRGAVGADLDGTCAPLKTLLEVGRIMRKKGRSRWRLCVNWSWTLASEQAGGVTGARCELLSIYIHNNFSFACPFVVNHIPATRDRTAIILISELNELTPRP